MFSLINGREASTIPVDDRGLAFGDGLFETVLLKHGQPVWLDEHLKRLEAGCRRLHLDCDPALLRHEISQLLNSAPPAPNGVLKVLITRSSEGHRGYRPRSSNCNRLLLCQPTSPWHKQWEEGIATVFCETRLGRNPALAGIKHLNRLEQVLASAELQDLALDEGFMLDDRGAVIEGTMSNLFAVTDSKLSTPLLDNCGVAGIVRDRILSWCNEYAIPCREQQLFPDDLYRAQELFISNSLIGIVPVIALQDHRKALGPMTRKLQQAFTRFWHD